MKNGKLSKAKAKAACYYCCSCYLANARQTKLEQKLNLPSVFFFFVLCFWVEPESRHWPKGKSKRKRRKITIMFKAIVLVFPFGFRLARFSCFSACYN